VTQHHEFRPQTIWSLSDAVTSALKELEPIPQFKVTAKLGEFLENMTLAHSVLAVLAVPAEPPLVFPARLRANQFGGVSRDSVRAVVQFVRTHTIPSAPAPTSMSFSIFPSDRPMATTRLLSSQDT
jgi:hypothetical protein